MQTFNKVILACIVHKGPIITRTATNQVATLHVYTEDILRKPDHFEKQKVREYHEVIFYNNLVPLIETAVFVKSFLLIEGKLQSRIYYDEEGRRLERKQIIGHGIKFLNEKPASNSSINNDGYSLNED